MFYVNMLWTVYVRFTYPYHSYVTQAFRKGFLCELKNLQSSPGCDHWLPILFFRRWNLLYVCGEKTFKKSLCILGHDSAISVVNVVLPCLSLSLSLSLSFSLSLSLPVCLSFSLSLFHHKVNWNYVSSLDSNIYIYIYIYCHVISHWDDGSGMTAVWVNRNLTWVTSSSPYKIAWPVGGGGR